MARLKSPTLTDAELRLMQVLWKHGPSSVSAVTDALPKKLGLAYSTVLTTLRILEQKGYVTHRNEGRAFIYEPVIGKDEAQQKAVQHLLGRLFEGSPELLLHSILENERLSPEELQRLRDMIDRME